MARHHRVFIAFAIEDKWAAINLAGQAKNDRSPFSFVDMSVKQPWDEAWKTACRTRIRGCDGAIAIVSKNSAKADGQLWEIRTIRDEKIPLVGVYATTDDRPSSLPVELSGVRTIGWTWAGIKGFLDSL